MSIKATACTITLTTTIALDTMEPSHDLSVVVEEEFSFLQNNLGVLGTWMRNAARRLAPFDPIQVTDEMIEAFGVAWESTPAGESGARRRAGLAAALTLANI